MHQIRLSQPSSRSSSARSATSRWCVEHTDALVLALRDAASRESAAVCAWGLQRLLLGARTGERWRL